MLDESRQPQPQSLRYILSAWSRSRRIGGLAAILTLMTLIGCSPQPDPFPAKTPEEIKQLTDVTDGVVELIRSSERDPPCGRHLRP